MTSGFLFCTAMEVLKTYHLEWSIHRKAQPSFLRQYSLSMARSTSTLDVRCVGRKSIRFPAMLLDKPGVTTLEFQQYDNLLPCLEMNERAWCRWIRILANRARRQPPTLRDGRKAFSYLMAPTPPSDGSLSAIGLSLRTSEDYSHLARPSDSPIQYPANTRMAGSFSEARS